MILSPARRASRNRSATRRAVANVLAVLTAGVVITFPKNGGGPIIRGGGPGLNPQSPAFQKARAACGRP